MSLYPDELLDYVELTRSALTGAYSPLPMRLQVVEWLDLQHPLPWDRLLAECVDSDSPKLVQKALEAGAELEEDLLCSSCYRAISPRPNALAINKLLVARGCPLPAEIPEIQLCTPIEVLRFLVERGVQLDDQGVLGAAAHWGRVDILKYLILERNVQPNLNMLLHNASAGRASCYRELRWLMRTFKASFNLDESFCEQLCWGNDISGSLVAFMRLHGARFDTSRVVRPLSLVYCFPKVYPARFSMQSSSRVTSRPPSLPSSLRLV